MKSPRLLRGFSIVSAIFILVALAALGAFIVNISTNQQIGSALDVQGERAFQAARAGVEWGVYKVQATAAYNFGYTSIDPNTRACPTSPTSFTLPAAATTLAGFTVTVICTATTDPGSFGGPTVYRITATACNQPNVADPKCPNITNPTGFYVERRLEVSF
ncbi:MAG: pilus assembly PilX N-terminal domain-containing protein [Betaproteobacteria bacterium]|nr:pilus assembly PilX N-terminal domain-containing protein [Betaproteobacteria bacterium]